MILIDTGPLVALCDARDGRHRRARHQLGRLAADGFLTCEAVVAETCFHLPAPNQRRRLRGVLDGLRIEPAMTSDAGFRADVLAWLLKFGDQEPDWADGCLAVLASRDPKLKIWTFDREFRTTWRRSDGGVIPLATRG